MACDDPRFVIDYGKYVHPNNNKGSIGSIIAFLTVYCGLYESDHGQDSSDGFILRNGIVAKYHGFFEHPLMGWVPVFDFDHSQEAQEEKEHGTVAERRQLDLVIRDARYIDIYEYQQAKFLKRLVCGEFKEL